MLEVNRLSRSYANQVVVDDVSFSVNKGEVVGLLGHNGAGKTTIMKMLSGYLEPDRGQIFINGIDLSQDPILIQHNLGYLPENLPVYPEMTVVDYLDYAADLKGLRKNKKRFEIKNAIKATDLGDRLTDTILTLSRGYKQRVGVAQAILGNPKLLILDEPTNGLDPTQTEHMRCLIRDIAKDATVLLSTHIMQEVDAVCDRVFILNQGSLAVDARLDELRQSNTLQLVTSMPENKAKDLMSIDGVQAIHFIPGSIDDAASPFEHSYRITLDNSDQVKTTCAALSRHITKANFDLYSLQSERGDLETVFRQVSDAHSAADSSRRKLEEVSHAA